MDAMKQGWFSEIRPSWPGQCMSLEIDEVLHCSKSEYQDILVVKSKSYGTVLILDDAIQVTERDEFSYQEMITNLPLNCHPDPKKVLVIGGGDGGVVREVVKHHKVESVVLCEIDQQVIDVSKKFLPILAEGFQSPKLTVHVGDGHEFMLKNNHEFDVIITDSSDPDGPAETLFQQEYYEAMKKALKPGGIVCSQGESIWYHLDLIKTMMGFIKLLFPVVDYSYTTIPTYPGGQIGFILCSLNPETNFREPIHNLSEADLKDRRLKYYNSDIHKASFSLPQFAKNALDDAKTADDTKLISKRA